MDYQEMLDKHGMKNMYDYFKERYCGVCPHWAMCKYNHVEDCNLFFCWFSEIRYIKDTYVNGK